MHYWKKKFQTLKMKIKLFIILLFCGGCSAPKPLKTESIRKQIVYFKDERTGLCFAAILSDDPWDQNAIKSFVTVPCTKIDSLK